MKGGKPPGAARARRSPRDRHRLDFDVTRETKNAFEAEAKRVGVSMATLFQLMWLHWQGKPIIPPKAQGAALQI